MKATKIIICLVLCGQLVYSQSDSIPPRANRPVCVRTKSLTLTKLKKTHPFDKTAKVQLVSFKPAYESIPMSFGTIDTTKFIETKTINRKEENDLIDILYNYNFDPKVNKEDIVLDVAICYEPRNAVLFKNGKNEIISYLEICFECNRHKEADDLHLSEFCEGKYTLLKNYFSRIGIKFGVTELN